MTNTGFLILFIIILFEIFELSLEVTNIKYIKKIVYNNKKVLPDFLNIDEFKKTVDYQWDKVKILLLESTSKIIFLMIIFITGFIQWYANKIISYSNNEFLRALLFLGTFQLTMGFISLPFSFYTQFVVEEKYGFNNMSYALFFRDLVISLIIGGIIFTILIFIIIRIIEVFYQSWWLLASLSVFTFILFLNYLYPVLIAPLFNKFEPIEDNTLVNNIKMLSEKVGFNIREILKMDASKRSSHSNAYFTGFGKKKRVVIFDTLLNKLSTEELISVIAHELGHFKLKHIIKNLVISFVLILMSFLFIYFLIDKNYIYLWFGFYKSIFTGLFIITLLFTPLKFIISPILMSISRKFEFEADNFAVKLVNTKKHLKNALIKLHKENLSTPFAHPLYVYFNYSHPPLIKRIERLESYNVD